MANSLQGLKDTLRSRIVESADAPLRPGDCIRCGKPALERCYSVAGRREVAISGMCEVCFDAVCADVDEDDEV